MMVGRFILMSVVGVGLATPGLAQQATAADRNKVITVRYGTVLESEDVKLQGEAAGKGAVFGGLIGLYAGHDKSGKNQRASAAAGAALGAIVARVAEGSHKAEAYTIRMTSGEVIKVIQDHGEIGIGDCVSVEQGRTTNVRHVAAELCGGTPLRADVAVAEHHKDQADACQQAKDQFLAASDAETLAVAEQKVKVLCH
jgi:outer membrane lipoprotein SlyB